MSNPALIVPVILCGGSGTRLWPLSRELFPKQFLNLAGDQTLLQDTVARLSGLENLSQPLLVCNEEHRFIAAEQLRSAGIRHAGIILEPVGRNTAPATTIAALEAEQQHGPDAVLLVLPADHVITDSARFRSQIEQAVPAARAGRLVTLGVQPDHAETGYGYIQAGNPIDPALGDAICEVTRFVEKPDRKTAEAYVNSGEYHWNSGMFLFTAKTWLAAMQKHASDMLDACRAAFAERAQDMDFIRLKADAFAACPSNSIDYAVMEKTDAAAVLTLSAGWSDVGSFAALADIAEQDERGNVAEGDVILEDCENCVVRAGHRLVTAVGVKDHIIIETSDAILVAPNDRAQDVKRIVKRLAKEQRSERQLHRKVFRPWGAYEGIDAADRFQVKHITVSPGQKLSLQKHHHRAEHWIVVSGTALVTRGDETFLLAEDESTYLPLGTVHRLENPGRIPLELIEVQSGAYLGEDDIVRFEDDYGRDS